MNPASGALLSFAYILGLLSTAILGFPITVVSWEQYILLVIGFGVLGVVAAITLPRFWRTGPRPRLWLTTGIVAALAVIYFQMRIPQPASNEISNFVDSVNSAAQGQVVTVQGQVESIPRKTRSQRSKFWLQAEQLNEIEGKDNNGAVSQGVTGKLYVTVPLIQTTGLSIGQRIAITGLLYAPEPPKNPGAFDFQAYLARQGAFAGLSGLQITNYGSIEQSWGWWKLRQRILRAQVRWSGSPTGQLVSTMVLGRRAVDLPYEIRDEFIAAGLAHVLAASGFHIALILGLVLGLTRRMSARSQFIIGLSTLLIYVGLTGLQTSVMRAAIMGLGALIALLTQRKTKPLGSLLVAATILLLWNPLWIWDLGFELSFLATLGLLVTAPLIIKQLDWLPPVLASLLAVPLAASLWTLPLQLFVFYGFAPYSLVTNIICTPLITLISIGGFLSAVTALIFPLVGSSIAWLLNYPVQLLVWLVSFVNNLSGSTVAVGKISVIQLLLLYGLLFIGFIGQKLGRRWWLLVIVGVTLVIVPAWQTKIAQFQVTVLTKVTCPWS
ncbi:MAG: ComEC family competence protein [Symploca sp. SIO1A3]|nr:ComEC family competence protein [Symploca sp. SIO1A3]